MPATLPQLLDEILIFLEECGCTGTLPVQIPSHILL